MKIGKNIQIIIAVFLFLLSTSFFGHKNIVQGGFYGLYKYFLVFLLLLLWKDIIKSKIAKTIPNILKKITLMFVIAIVWAMIFHGQSLKISISAMAEDIPLIFFFLFMKYNFDNKSLVKAIFIGASLYTIVLLYCLSTFPNNVFAYSDDVESINRALYEFEQRGVLRLSVPGADIVISFFFLVLTYFKKHKIWYLLFIPIIIIMVLRGTRTPLFIAVSIGVGYLIWNLKYKWLIVTIILILICGGSVIYQKILKSNDDDPISLYVKMTQEQVKSNKNEKDIRIRMSEYFFTQYNDNPMEYIVGNGRPGTHSAYNQELLNLSNQKSYYIVDVGITYIFVYYGVIGLILYLILFVTLLKTPVEDEYMFAKLYIIYGYAILPTNVSILWTSPFIFALHIYILYRSNLNLKRKCIIK